MIGIKALFNRSQCGRFFFDIDTSHQELQNPMIHFELPSAIRELVEARDNVRDYYCQRMKEFGSDVALSFTLDGNLVGDIGEAISVELFGIRLDDTRATEGIDGVAPDGRTVQVKATGTGRGPVFRPTAIRAEHLLFFELDFKKFRGSVVFNGPEHTALKYMPPKFYEKNEQRPMTPKQIRRADEDVKEHERLPMVGGV
ncbi:hypothetical protein M3P21_22105 [Ruegeria sp. 2012CJ41-6]|uniref:DUF6998 domain-containing protein n=1 Tax=Ruegeria spongiae TaxID=2942209 RepID=A0ABT0Q8K9_9RHOB|nr:hypothetical protein [Ruegeria spongiae]MCL6286190.1 hypothetical protein [Ruegeria spongiae]